MELKFKFNLALPLLHYHWIIYVLKLLLLPESCGSLEFIRQYPTFPNHAARPKFIVQPDDQEVDQGARVQLRCTGEASPQPMLFWYKEGHRQLMFAPPSIIPGTPNAPKQQAAPLDWAQAAPLIASDYRFGGASSDTSPAINKLFTMPIGTDQLMPSSYSNSYFGDRIYVDNQGTLNIVNATLSDNGYYACALISSVGSVMAKAKLTVRQSINSPLVASDYYGGSTSQDSFIGRTANSLPGSNKFDLLPPPVIKLGAANQTLPTNTSATLVCEVVSQVAYKIQWFFESQPLQEEVGRVLVSMDTGTLQINNLRTSDSGIYTCVVTAATEQIMPLANPLDSFDSSMLTSAPPIQQSTSHSTMLKVASPMNPNIQFFRMDTYVYPSSPGSAYLVSTNGNDAITIAWPAPSDSGTLPIKEYIVEHYDTSQEHLGWRVIYKIKGKESLLIDGLSAEGSHFFVIRAANSHGTGPSSSIAGPMRTVAGESRYQAEISKRRNPTDVGKLNQDPLLLNNAREDNTNLARERLMTISTNLLTLTPVSSSSIKLQWSTQVAGNLSNVPRQLGSIDLPPLMNTPDVNEFLEGYSIRYRATGIGESLLSNIWASKNFNVPSSLPLVTSYIDEKPSLSRKKRDLMNYFDYSQEFNEVRVVDHNTEHYTVNGLRPFTLYQFFVVPYYKDIDGIPSNILSAQTNEDRPAIAPPNLTVRSINITAIRLLWLHVPPIYANGILRGYTIRLNRSEILSGQPSEQQLLTETPRIINLPLGSITAAPATPYNHANPAPPNGHNLQQYILMYDITNLTYKSFYAVQVAAMTIAGAGPWSDAQNFVMDPVLLQLRSSGSELDDVMSKSLISSGPQSYNRSMSNSEKSLYIIVSIILVIISVVALAGFILHRRNNQRVLTWKKTISDHFTSKFYLPSDVDHRGSNSIQQNIYDHQQHLIYSGGSTHVTHQSTPAQNIWPNNHGCINSGGTGSLSSHGGLIPINNDPNGRKVSGEQQMLLLNNKQDNINSRFVKSNQQNLDQTRTMQNRNQMIQHSDYYSVINNVAEYEELDPQQRNNIQLITNGDRIQTASSNSDTSCPSSVTRLIPHTNYNRELSSKTFNDNKHEMILQQQIGCNESKQPFATIINGDTGSRMQPIVPLSPYATTNLMNQVSVPQQVLTNHQMNFVDHSRPHNYFIHNNGAGGNLTLDDSAKGLMNQQQTNGFQNPVSVFRTLQRNPMNFQSRGQQVSQLQPHIFTQNIADLNGSSGVQNHLFNLGQQQQLQVSPMLTNITSNPLTDMKPNLYEHVNYLDNDHVQGQPTAQQKFINQQVSQTSNDIISSSTSSGSMKSPSQQHSPDQQQPNQASNGTKFRRGSSNTNYESEAHDLRVFSSQQPSRQTENTNERHRLNCNSDHQPMEENYDDDESMSQANETTAFRQKSNQSDNQRARQLSKRKRQQQRNRQHNNNQKVGQ